MRVVVDPNVLISAAVATGVSAQLVDRWLTERPFEIVTWPALLAELGEVLRRGKFRRWIDHDVVDRFVDLIQQESESWPDPVEVAPVTSDPKDDYLVALYRHSVADLIVSGDPDLTSMSVEDMDVLTPGELLKRL